MKRWVDYLIIMFVGLITHGLLLLNDGVYWDGWILYSKLVKKGSLSQWFIEAGRPFDFCFHWALGHFPDYILGYRLIVFLSIMFIGVLIYEICNRSKLVTRGEGLLIALIVLTYPVFNVGIEITIAPYLFFYMLFCLAVFFAFRAKETVGIVHCVWRLLSLFIFFVSFSLYSLLIFFFGFILILIVYECRLKSFSLRQIILFFPRHIDYLILPFIFWFWNQRVFLLSEFYKQRSDKLFQFAWAPMKNCFIGFLKYAVCDQWAESAGKLFLFPLCILLIFLFAWWIFNTFKITIFSWFKSRVSPWHFIIAGIVMFIAGVFPYLVVGAYPKMYSWDTRNALLLGLPVSLILVGLFRLIFFRRGENLGRLGFVIIVTLIAAFSLSNINTYLFRQAAWIKVRSVIYNLSQKRCAKNISFFSVDQRVGIPPDEENYFYVWASIFAKSWGDESHIGFPGRFSPLVVNTIGNYYIFIERGYNFNDAALDPKGAQVILVISPGPEAKDSLTMAMRYFKCRFFRPENMGDYLASVTLLHMEIAPREGPRVDGI